MFFLPSSVSFLSSLPFQFCPSRSRPQASNLPAVFIDHFTIFLIVAVKIVIYILYIVMHVCIGLFFLPFLLLLKKIKFLFLFVVFLRNKIGFFASAYCITMKVAGIDEENVSILALPSTPVTPRHRKLFFLTNDFHLGINP